MQVGSIGQIVFEVSSQVVRTFQEWTDSETARISAHEIGGGLPILEFVGPGTRSLEIPVQLNAQLGADIEADIATAQGYCRTGAVLPLVIGGKPVGGAGAKWLIESVETSRQKFATSGTCVLADLRLSLQLARTATTPALIGTTVTKSNTQRVKK